MGVPSGFDQVSVTKPYYRSTYALVFPPSGLDHGQAAPTSCSPTARCWQAAHRPVRPLAGVGEWLAKHGLVDNGVPYKILNADPAQYPGEIIEKDLAAGQIDAAVVWGPIAGFFAKRVKSPALVVVPLRSEPGVKFDYEMAMGVRYGERSGSSRSRA